MLAKYQPGLTVVEEFSMASLALVSISLFLFVKIWQGVRD